MGATYRAEDLRLAGRICAVKEALPDPEAPPEELEQSRDQFYKEVFNPKYHTFAPAILLHNLEQRVYQPRYVWGWYANSANPNQWFYPLWKE